ncbi:MAG: terminase family protein, partial [Myxococcales bacterium]|nr:terminase family protein [Myxococcales bacterium]
MVAHPAHHALADVADCLSIIGARRRARPIDHVAWLPLQYEFLSDSSPIKQIRAGNQFVGKTWAALAEVIGRCLGRHPLGLGVPPPPITAWVVCAEWSQSLGIQEKLAELLPWDEVDPRTSYDAVNGFSPTKRPCIKFRNGSRIWIKTTKQDAISFAGATIDVVLFDEPPKAQRTFVEALQRIQERSGVLLLSYTPVNAPTDYLRELVEAGTISDHWRRITPAELIPVGRTLPLRTRNGRLKDQAYIDHRRSLTPEYEQPVVIDGEWEFRGDGAYFDGAWDPAKHVFRARLEKWDHLVLGIDHGDRPGKQVAVLMELKARFDEE